MKLINIKKIADGRKILNDVSIEFDNRGMVFIIGTSGAGKSTLLNIISGIDCEYEGEIVIDDNIIDSKVEDNYRKNVVGTIYQDFNLISNISVEENIRLGRKISGLDENGDLFKSIVSKLKIDNILSRSVEALSGGERQRVAIARALYRENEIICADEPTGNLDVANSDSFFELLKDVSKEKLCVVVSHDLEAAKKYADRIIEISDGMIINDTKISNEDISDLNRPNIQKKNIKWIYKYSKNGFSVRLKKQLGVVMTMVLSMICLMLILGFVTSANDMVYKIDSTYLENDKYYVTSEDLSQNVDDIETKIKDLSGVKETLGYCSFKCSINEEDDYSNINVVEDNDFFRERYSDIQGQLPKKNQIMISSNLAQEKFGKNEVIGKKIRIFLNTGRSYELEIAAVKDVYFGDEYEYYVSKETIGEFVKDSVLDGIYLNFNNEYGDVDLCVKYIDESNESNIILGRMPSKKNEMLINISAYNYILQSINPNMKSLSKEDIKKNIQKYSWIFDDNILIKQEGFIPDTEGFKIVGVIDDEGKYEYETNNIYLNVDYLASMIKNTTLVVFSKNISGDSFDEWTGIVKNQGMLIANNSKFKSNALRNRILSIAAIVAIIAIIVTIISAVVMHYFMKISIVQRQYEISILRGMGARKRDIFKMMIFEQGYIAVIVVLSTVVMIAILMLSGIMNKFTMDGISMYSFKIWHIGVVIITAIVSILLFSIGDIKKASQINIVDGLREKYKL